MTPLEHFILGFCIGYITSTILFYFAYMRREK
jgi:hypothetical protein